MVDGGMVRRVRFFGSFDRVGHTMGHIRFFSLGVCPFVGQETRSDAPLRTTRSHGIAILVRLELDHDRDGTYKRSTLGVDTQLE